MKIYRITAMWCMSCLAMKKIWKNVFKDIEDLQIIDIDYDESKELIETLKVGKILPELIVYKGNKEIRIVGEKTKKEMYQILEGLNEKT